MRQRIPLGIVVLKRHIDNVQLHVTPVPQLIANSLDGVAIIVSCQCELGAAGLQLHSHERVESVHTHVAIAAAEDRCSTLITTPTSKHGTSKLPSLPRRHAAPAATSAVRW